MTWKQNGPISNVPIWSQRSMMDGTGLWPAGSQRKEEEISSIFQIRKYMMQIYTKNTHFLFAGLKVQLCFREAPAFLKKTIVKLFIRPRTGILRHQRRFRALTPCPITIQDLFLKKRFFFWGLPFINFFNKTSHFLLFICLI